MNPTAAPGSAPRMLPDVPLFSAEGGEIRLSDYRHRKHLVLLVFGTPAGDEGRCVPDSLAARRAEFADESAEVIVVFPASTPRSAAPMPFPVLEDRTGALHDELHGNGSRNTALLTVYVADRYGEVFRSLEIRAGDPFPTEEILAWLRFLERLCPE
jgi:hypothetical protein